MQKSLNNKNSIVNNLSIEKEDFTKLLVKGNTKSFLFSAIFLIKNNRIYDFSIEFTYKGDNVKEFYDYIKLSLSDHNSIVVNVLDSLKRSAPENFEIFSKEDKGSVLFALNKEILEEYCYKIENLKFNYNDALLLINEILFLVFVLSHEKRALFTKLRAEVLHEILQKTTPS